MNLSVVLRDISYFDSKGDVCPSTSNYVNYKDSIQSLKTNLISSLSRIFNNINFYIVTYDNELIDDIRKDFNPISEKIYPSDDIYKVDRYTVVKRLILDSLELLENSKQHKNDDYILIIRFDMYYIKPFDLNTINLNKFNFGWIGEVNQSDDNFLLFHTKYSKYVKEYFNYNDYSHRLNIFSDQVSYIYNLLPDYSYNFYIFNRHIKDYQIKV